MPAIRGMALAMAACTHGMFRDASWFSFVSQTSVIQIVFSSVGSVAMSR